jgi:hypothetical protein
MSGLKSYNSERIYWAVEQVEREAGDIDNLHLDDNLFYIKSEADKVIAELEKDVEAWIDGFEASRRVNARTESKLRHSNYKRCLVMAKICENKLGTVVKPGWWDKWRSRWLELAEKFKDKEAQ